MHFDLKDSGEREEFPTGARRDSNKGKGRFDLLPPHAMERLALVYERGAEKYGEENYLLGMPEKRFIESAMRHINEYQKGRRDEDHLIQAVWNLMAIVEIQSRNTQYVCDVLPPKHGAFVHPEGNSYWIMGKRVSESEWYDWEDTHVR